MRGAGSFQADRQFYDEATGDRCDRGLILLSCSRYSILLAS
jgi:hypothetical protein